MTGGGLAPGIATRAESGRSGERLRWPGHGHGARPPPPRRAAGLGSGEPGTGHGAGAVRRAAPGAAEEARAAGDAVAWGRTRALPTAAQPRTPGLALSSRQQLAKSPPSVSVLPDSAAQPQHTAQARWLTCTLRRHLQEEKEKEEEEEE